MISDNASDVTCDLERSERHWRKGIILLRTLMLCLLWAGVVYVVVRLGNEYQDRKKETVALEAVNVDYLDPPSLYVDTETLTDCVFVLNVCTFSSGVNCSSAVTKFSGDSGESVHILDSRKLLSLGIRFFTPTDILRLEFMLVFRENNTKAELSECTLLNGSRQDAPEETAPVESAGMDPVLYVPGYWQIVIPIGDLSIVDALLNDTSYDPKRIGSLTFVGFGQSAHLSFGLEQESFTNGEKVKNTTTFGMTQYPFRRNHFQVLLSPSSFTIRKIQHNKGQSEFELLGSLFGWFGILVGASAFSLFNDIVGLVDRLRNRALTEKHVLDVELGSITHIHHSER
eukprot:TRINITY_DN8110_c0_g1_i2.p1 TRINITY_DN8110_c0_g1~~TRINITY_DN8110_c0_g1_i2.p1  ORF type:complete len:342 (+),score=41.69 TRINITY_DN8110_c0_g1_i2:31-1056(+)